MSFIPDAVTKTIARQIITSQKHAPSILFGTGIAGVVGSTVLACKATLSLEVVIQKAANDVRRSERMVKDAPEEYTEAEHQKVLKTVKRRAAVEIGTLYAPAIILGVGSIAALTSAHGILTKRNAALTAAYAALDKGFKEYRSRVREEYGEEKEHELRFPRESYETTDENGKKVTKTRVAPGAESIYAKLFDQLCSPWSPDPEYNMVFLKCQQEYANQMLRARGHVLLNDVYDALDIPRTKAGAVVGWVLNGNGDNYIDFGIFDGTSQAARDFVNGREGAILLDFNVDGNVLDLIENPGEAVAWQS